MVKCGDTFLAGPDQEKLHLHVVVTDPTVNGEAIVVSITTLRTRSDRTVQLNIGDHPFIRHPSVVAYGFAQIELIAVIEEDIATNRALPRESMAMDIVQRIRDGLLESDFTENGVRHFFRELEQGR